MDIPLSIEEASAALRSGELTSVELLERCIAQAERLDETLGTYLARFDEGARALARQANADFAVGVDRGPLQGIPVAVKDLLAVREGPTTAQSVVLDRQWGAGRDATVVARLRAAGAVLTGKTTTMEFAAGFPHPQQCFPFPRHPWDLARWPGGSSSGAANGVSAGLFLAGVGTDTGGSIRLPAAFVGITGIKPTFGRVSKAGCVPTGYSLDHVGALARTAWDCAAMLEAMAGYDPADTSSVDRVVPRYVIDLDRVTDLTGVRVGLVSDGLRGEGADPAAERCFASAVMVLESLGATTEPVTIPYEHVLHGAMLITSVSESLAYHRDDLARRWLDYLPTTREVLGLAAFVAGGDYVQAQRVRRVAQRAVADLLGRVDVILMPTATISAPTYAHLEEHGVLSTMRNAFTMIWGGLGNPVLAVPMGFASDDLPLGLQIVGRPFDESTILRVGHAYQQATDWHRRLPALAVAGGAA
jgi:aspartyl-tRNA(Asn)/glutamyl-tRNA(Gln) amidotransferase subunit A